MGHHASQLNNSFIIAVTSFGFLNDFYLYVYIQYTIYIQLNFMVD